MKTIRTITVAIVVTAAVLLAGKCTLDAWVANVVRGAISGLRAEATTEHRAVTGQTVLRSQPTIPHRDLQAIPDRSEPGQRQAAGLRQELAYSAEERDMLLRSLANFPLLSPTYQAVA